MPNLPKILTIELRAHFTLVLTAQEAPKEISGLSDKAIYIDSDGLDYYVKAPKHRKVEEIFQHDPFFNELIFQRWELLNSEHLDPIFEATDDVETRQKINMLSHQNRITFAQIEAKLEPYKRHVDELMMVNTAIEVLASHLCAAIMGNLIIVPHNYLYIHEGKPLIISPSVGKLREFLSEHPLVGEAKRPEHWLIHAKPSFASLVTTTEQARMLGQAYFVALLFGPMFRG